MLKIALPPPLSLSPEGIFGSLTILRAWGSGRAGWILSAPDAKHEGSTLSHHIDEKSSITIHIDGAPQGQNLPSCSSLMQFLN